MMHRFNTDIADAYSIHEALLIQHIDFILNNNKANNRNVHNERFWMVGSVAGLHRIYDYLTPRQIHNTLENLRGKTTRAKKRPELYPVLLASKDLNRRSDDKTLWYTFTDEFIGRFHGVLDFCHVHKTEGEAVMDFYADVCLNSGETRPTRKSLLQMCKRLEAYRASYPELKDETLLQICKTRLTNLEEGIYKIVKHIRNDSKNNSKDLKERAEENEPAGKASLSSQEKVFKKWFEKKKLNAGQVQILEKIEDLDLMERACEHLVGNGHETGNIGTIKQVMKEIAAKETQGHSTGNGNGQGQAGPLFGGKYGPQRSDTEEGRKETARVGAMLARRELAQTDAEKLTVLLEGRREIEAKSKECNWTPEETRRELHIVTKAYEGG